jgi:iron(III) transport system ATP-binding protein
MRRFLGEVDELQIAVDGLDKPLTARFAQPGSVREGEDVGLDISTDEVLVFPAGDT